MPCLTDIWAIWTMSKLLVPRHGNAAAVHRLSRTYLLPQEPLQPQSSLQQVDIHRVSWAAKLPSHQSAKPTWLWWVLVGNLCKLQFKCEVYVIASNLIILALRLLQV